MTPMVDAVLEKKEMVPAVVGKKPEIMSTFDTKPMGMSGVSPGQMYMETGSGPLLAQQTMRLVYLQLPTLIQILLV